MSVIIFASKNALADLLRQRKRNIIVIITLALGMIMPIVCLGNIYLLVEKLPIMRLNDSQRVWVLSFETGNSDYSKFSSHFLQEYPEIDRFAVAAEGKATVSIRGSKQTVIVGFLSDNWSEFEQYRLISGETESFSFSHKCIVDKEFASQHEDLQVGEQVLIMGIPHEIIGIISSFHFSNTILVSISELTELPNCDALLSMLYLHTQASDFEASALSKSLSADGLTPTSVFQGNTLHDVELKNTIRQSALIILVGLASFAFAAINICIVLIGKLLLDKRVTGIRLVLGATSGSILFSMLIENMLSFICSFCIAIVLVFVLKPTYPAELTVSLNIQVFLVAFLFGSILTMIMTWIASRKVNTKHLVGLLERVS